MCRCFYNCRRVRLNRVNANYLLAEKENIPMKLSGKVPAESVKDHSEDFAVGQIVWVWLSGHPLWPGMIAEAPEGDKTHPGKFFRVHNGGQR